MILASWHLGIRANFCNSHPVLISLILKEYIMIRHFILDIVIAVLVIMILSQITGCAARTEIYHCTLSQYCA